MGLSQDIFRGFGGRSKRPKTAIKAQEPSPALLFAPEAEAPSQKKASLLPRFKASAADHVDRRRTDRFVSMRMKLRSAFTPSQPVVDPRMFAGRHELLHAMIGSLEDQRLHLVVYGQRGIGKTSMMHMLADAARNARYIVHYASCGATSNFEETFRAAAADIPLLFHTAYGPTTEEGEGGSTFADLLPEGSFSPRQFGELCARLTGTRALIILDEFDRSDSKEFRRELAELMKTLSDRTVRVQLIIAGVAGDLDELVEHIPSIRRNIQAIRVPAMTESEIETFIAAGESAIGLTFEPGAREMVVRATCGSPYFASLTCHRAGLEAIDDARTNVQAADVSNAVDQIMREFQDRLGHQHRAHAERLIADGAGRLLTALAGASLKAGGEFDSRDIEMAASGAVEAAAARRLVDELAAKQMLFEVRDEGGERRYAPLEDGLAPYLWFRGLAKDAAPATAGARASAAR